MNPELSNSQLRLEKKSNIENKLVGKEIPEPQNSQILLEKKSNIENKLVEKSGPWTSKLSNLPGKAKVPALKILYQGIMPIKTNKNNLFHQHHLLGFVALDFTKFQGFFILNG